MFSGIIETVGTIDQIDKTGEGLRLSIASTLPLSEIKLGDSVACNGCCLTITQLRPSGFEVFISHESLARTSFAKARPGEVVNLERSVAVGQRLDGHVVQGHVEAVGVLKAIRKMGDSTEIDLLLPAELRALVIPKGSITVDGVSLTVNTVHDEKDGVLVKINLIPFTLSKTAFRARRLEDLLNIETDLFGRYVLRALEVHRQLGK